MAFLDLLNTAQSSKPKPIVTTKLTKEKVEVPSLSTSCESILLKINELKAHLNDQFIEREEIIHQLFVTLVTGSNLLLLGPPGTGKSNLIIELTKHIEGANLFNWLLNRTSDPSEIVGPFSMKGMEKDEFYRVTTGKLPEAEIVFLDEIFKSNEPTLNILLSLINEKLFYNGPTPIKVPLVSLFAASNEFPAEDEGLEALYDRLLIRIWVNYIKNPNNRLALLENASKPSKPDLPIKLTLADITELQQECENVDFHPMVLSQFNVIITQLIEQGIEISDRRLVKALKVLKATALLDHRNVVYTDDLIVLKDVLWSKQEDYNLIFQTLREKSNPFGTDLRQLVTSLKTLKSEEDLSNTTFLTKADKQIKRIAKDFNELYKKVSTYGANPKTLNDFKKALGQYGNHIIEEGLKKI